MRRAFRAWAVSAARWRANGVIGTLPGWPAYEKLYIRAFDKMLEIRRQRGKLGGSWRSDTTGEDVFHWWMEDGVLPGQLSFDEYRAPIQTEKEDEWEETTA